MERSIIRQVPFGIYAHIVRSNLLILDFLFNVHKCYYLFVSINLLTYYTYIVECSDGSYYTGKTSNITRRMKQHNGLLAGGAKYTKLKRPVKLVHVENYTTNKFACNREAEIKKLSHEEKRKLCLTKS